MQPFLSTRDHLIEDVFGMIRTSDERTREHPANSEAQAKLAQFRELVRVVIPFDFSMLHRWSQILPDRHDVDSGKRGIVHELDDFFLLFTKAHHDSRIDEYPR